MSETLHAVGTIFINKFEVFKLDFDDAHKLDVDPKKHTKYIWLSPEVAYTRKDLMVGLYQILADLF